MAAAGYPAGLSSQNTSTSSLAPVHPGLDSRRSSAASSLGLGDGQESAAAGQANTGFEYFVLVRPPNGFDIQVQLLSQRHANASEATVQQESPLNELSHESLADLKRTASSRSNRSSVASSSGLSVASGFTTNNVKKRTLPLYNLQFHKLSPTVVTDAGTDAKIAKFTKRGIEMLDFACLEPVEENTRPASNKRASTMSSTQSAQTRAVSPEPLHLQTPLAKLASNDTASTQTPTTQEKEKPASLLNKFKRMSWKPASLPNFLNVDVMKGKPGSAVSSAAPSPVSIMESTHSTQTSAGSTALSILEAPKHALALFKTREREDSTTSTIHENSVAVMKPLRKSISNSYTWQTRKWLRKDLENKELVFRDFGVQWRRQRKHHVRSHRSPSPGPGTTSEAPSESAPLVNSTSNSSVESSDLLHPLGNKRSDPSMASRSSVNLDPDQDTGTDDGDESDPEDSERAWYCDLILPTLPLSASARKLRRIRLGTLKPAPHHPRLVGQLNVPLSLAPISLGLEITVLDETGAEREGVAHISAEEMKDLLCVTALFLVINQGLGGVGNRKKGDSAFRFS